MRSPEKVSYLSITALRSIIWIALCSALIIVGSYITIPLPFTPIPIVLQNFFVLLAALLLGARRATIAVAIFLFLGALGLPVFSAGRGGIAHLLGPTGGYLIGYLLAAPLSALCAGSQQPTNVLWRQITGVVVGTIVIYLCGIPWLKISSGLSWSSTLVAGLYPFLIGDVLKAIAVVGLARSLRRRLTAQFNPSVST